MTLYPQFNFKNIARLTSFQIEALTVWARMEDADLKKKDILEALKARVRKMMK